MSTAKLGHFQSSDHQHYLGTKRLSAGRTAGLDLLWWSMSLASLTALVVSVYLLWASLNSTSVAGCSGGVFDCSHVLTSRWSKILSIPVSAPAIATHVTIIAMLLWNPQKPSLNQFRWSAIGLATLCAFGAALWFVGLQVFYLKHLCPYCLVAHTAAIILACLFLSSRVPTLVTRKWLAAAAVIAIGALITIQSTSAAPQTFEVIELDASDPTMMVSPLEEAGLEETKSEESVEDESPVLFSAPAASSSEQASVLSNDLFPLVAGLLNPAMLMTGELDAGESGEPTEKRKARILRNVELDTSTWPLLGNPSAELVFVELFDYTCPHCQRTHQTLEQAREQYGDRLAVITLPVPLDTKCNPTVKTTHASHREACEIAKLAVAVWIVDRESFETLHNYVFDAKANYAQAMAKARSLVNAQELNQALQGDLPSQYIAKHVALYQKAGSGVLPKLLFPKTTTAGAVESKDSMVRLIQQHLE